MADKTQQNACDVAGVKRRVESLESSKDFDVNSKVRRVSDDQEAFSYFDGMNGNFVESGHNNSNIGQEPLKEEDAKPNAENSKILNADMLRREQHGDAIPHVSNLNTSLIDYQHQPQQTIPCWYTPNGSNYIFSPYYPSRHTFQHSPYTYDFWLPNQVTSRDFMIVQRGVIYNSGNFVVHDFERFTYYNESQTLSNFNPHLNY